MFSPSLLILYGLSILEEDVVGANLGDCAGFNSGHFLGHGPDLVEVHVG
jgi:hypothetical protein